MLIESPYQIASDRTGWVILDVTKIPYSLHCIIGKFKLHIDKNRSFVLHKHTSLLNLSTSLFHSAFLSYACNTFCILFSVCIKILNFLIGSVSDPIESDSDSISLSDRILYRYRIRGRSDPFDPVTFFIWNYAINALPVSFSARELLFRCSFGMTNFLREQNNHWMDICYKWMVK